MAGGEGRSAGSHRGPALRVIEPTVKPIFGVCFLGGWHLPPGTRCRGNQFRPNGWQDFSEAERGNFFTLKSIEPIAKRQFCNSNEVCRLRWNKAGRGFSADGEVEGADENIVMQLPQSINIKAILFLQFLLDAYGTALSWWGRCLSCRARDGFGNLGLCGLIGM